MRQTYTRNSGLSKKTGENSVHTAQEGIIMEHLPRNHTTLVLDIDTYTRKAELEKFDNVKEVLVGSSSQQGGVDDESMMSKNGKIYSTMDADPTMLSLNQAGQKHEPSALRTEPLQKEDMAATEPNAAVVDTPGMRLSELHLDSAPFEDKGPGLEIGQPVIVTTQMVSSMGDDTHESDAAAEKKMLLASSENRVMESLIPDTPQQTKNEEVMTSPPSLVSAQRKVEEIKVAADKSDQAHTGLATCDQKALTT